MTSGPGRFANGAQFDLINSFFTEPLTVLATPGQRTVYNLSQLMSHLGLNNVVQFEQVFYDDFQNDRAERSYLFNTQSYRIHDQAIFVIEANGTRHVDNLQIVPFDEDFDFNGGWISNLVNPYLQARIDPWSIGITVDITYDGDFAPQVNYTQLQWDSDRAYLTNSYSPISGPIEAFLNPLVENLFNAGVTRFIDPQGRAIIYGTTGTDYLRDENDLLFYSGRAPLLAPYFGNGVVFIGNSGSDQLAGAGTDDDLRGGAGDDIIFGWLGNDVMDGGNRRGLAASGDGIDTADYSFKPVSHGLHIQLGVTGPDGVVGTLVSDDGNGGQDWLYSIENIIGTNEADTLVLGPQALGLLPSIVSIDLGTSLGVDPDRVDLSSLTTGLTINLGATGPTFSGNGPAVPVVGAEIVIGTSGADSINGGSAGDSVSGGGGDDKIIGGAGDDDLFGENGNDLIKGDDAGADLLLGAAGADYIIGGDGDIIDGGPGNDYMEATGTNGVTFTFTRGSGQDVIASLFAVKHIPAEYEGNPDYTLGTNYAEYVWLEDRLNDVVKFENLSPDDIELIWDFSEEVTVNTGFYTNTDRYGEAAIRIKDTGDTLFLGMLDVRSFDYSVSGGATWDGVHANVFTVVEYDNDLQQEPTNIPGQAAIYDNVVDFAWMEFAGGTRLSIDKVFDLMSVVRADLPANYSSALTDYSSGAGSNGADDLTGTNGSDILLSGPGRDRLFGGDGDDFVFASSGTDTIEAGSGAGNDYYDGGVGVDKIEFPSTSLGVIVDLMQGIADGPEIGHDILVSIENVSGGSGGDQITGDNDENTLEGGGGTM